MHNTTGDVTLTNIRRETKLALQAMTDEHQTRNKILKTKLYMHNTTVDVTPTNIRRETKY